MSNKRKQLPIGIQTFREIREDGHYYVDKTQLALNLAKDGKHYFLSRPRRFGKSLFIDTLKELFIGSKSLFTGLAAEQQWDWSVQYPVLTFSFSGNNYDQPGQLELDIIEQLNALDKKHQHQPQNQTCPGRFRELIQHLEQQHGQRVVVLIDEYDKPIMDALNAPDVAKANRNFLRSFYSTIKDNDAYVKFSFLTGVSKFSKVSIFSGLNNLYDLSLDPEYATVCGYTDHDLDTVFVAELEGLDREKIKAWYNGYNWRGEGVYNPFDILQLFKRREFSNYWFETGTPTFLVDFLVKRRVPTLKLDNVISSASILSSFDIENLKTESLLFQTGYLTIKHRQQAGGQVFYTLGYPNQEVYQSLNENLLSVLTNSPEQEQQTLQLHQLLMDNNFNGLKDLFHRFFATIPYQWYTNNTIQQYEGYYASVFYSYFAALGLHVTVEDSTNLGRIDMTLQFNQQVYIFEFKVVELVPEGKALQQIKDRAYADKYRADGQPVHLVGVEFSRDNRNIVAFEVETA